MKRNLFTILFLIASLVLNARSLLLSREEMQDSILCYLDIQYGTSSLKGNELLSTMGISLNYAKIFCTQEKIYGFAEQNRNKLRAITNDMSDSDLEKTFKMAKLLSRKKSPEYSASYYPKDNLFVVNDKETDDYLNIIYDYTGIHNMYSLLKDGMANENNYSQDGQMNEVLDNIITMSVSISKETDLMFYTKQELRELSEYLTVPAIQKVCEIWKLYEQEFRKIADMRSAEDFFLIMDKLTDIEIARFADKYLSTDIHATPVPHEIGQLTLKTGNYVGEIWNGQANGIGELTDAKGNVYKGDFLNNKKDGYGTLYSPKGVKKVGYWKEDKFLKDTLNNLEYGFHVVNEISITRKGVFKHGLLNGKGSVKLYNGEGCFIEQEGTFVEGEMVDGIVKISTKGNSKYIIGKGSFNSDFTGFGIVQIHDKNKNYIIEKNGYMIGGNLIGRGKLTLQYTDHDEKREYKGYFMNGGLIGKGSLITLGKMLNDGSSIAQHQSGLFYNNLLCEGSDTIQINKTITKIYNGTFHEGTPAKCKYSDYVDGKLNSEYEGEFKDYNIHGQGVMKFPNGFMEEGTWNNGKLHGTGKRYYTNGVIVEGKWNNGVIDGKGIVYKTDGSTIEGTFISGECYDGVLKNKAGNILKRMVNYRVS